VTLEVPLDAVRAFRFPGPSGPLRRAAIVLGDLLALTGLVLCLPFVILALGTPVVLFVRLLLWISGAL
jgi:hypothetical protein